MGSLEADDSLLFLLQAAYYGHYSFRSRSGSWFVQALCRCLDESSPEEDLSRALTRAKRHVSLYRESNVPSSAELDRKRQIPLVQDTLIRDLYLKRAPLNGNGALEEREGDSDGVSVTKEDEGDHRKKHGDEAKKGKDKDKCKVM